MESCLLLIWRRSLTPQNIILYMPLWKNLALGKILYSGYEPCYAKASSCVMTFVPIQDLKQRFVPE